MKILRALAIYLDAKKEIDESGRGAGDSGSYFISDKYNALDAAESDFESAFEELVVKAMQKVRPQ